MRTSITHGISKAYLCHYDAAEKLKHFKTVSRSVGMGYRCVAASPEGFVQQLAVAYLAHGYWFYVSGFIPGDKNLEDVDRKLVWKYGIGRSRSARARRKALGIANVHYIRYKHRFLPLATHGHQ